MKTEWAEIWKRNVEGFLWNCDRCSGGMDDFVQELIHGIVNNPFRITVLLKIGEEIGYLFVNG